MRRDSHSPRGRRATERLWRHHVPIAAVTALLILAFHAVLDSPDGMFRWSMATAYVGLALIAATLVTGPIIVLRGARPAVSLDLRRDLGFWAAAVSALHVFVGLQVHMGSPWLYFFADGFPERLAPRLGAFGVANYVGLAATIIILALAAISSDAALKWLGRDRWKAWQRWNYGLFALAAGHGALFQLVESRPLPFVVLLGSVALLVIALQLGGRRARRRRPAAT